MNRSPLVEKCGALSLAAALILSGCGPQTADPSSIPATTTTSTVSATTTSIVTEPTAAPVTDASLWFSEKAGVRGRIWLGMSVKEVYDVLVKYQIEIVTVMAGDGYEYDEYGAMIDTGDPDTKVKKSLQTYGHQYFEFDKNDRLFEITYLEKIHSDDEPVNEEYFSEKGLKRGDSYERMVELYGQPDKRIKANDVGDWSYVYRMENGQYALFTFYEGNMNSLRAISYSLYDTLAFFE